MNEIITVGATGKPYLYHYQPFDLARIRSVIVDRQLYFSRPSSFNDPWDCKPYYSIDLSNPEWVAAHAAYFERIDRTKNAHLTEAELVARVRRYREDLPFLEHCVREMHTIHQAIDERYRLYCLAGSPMVSLMWSHYARSHTGVCFQFGNAGPFQLALRVEYREQYPSISLVGSTDALMPLVAKSSDWSYEDEYRLIAEETAEGTGPFLNTRNNIFRFPPEHLKTVYLGCQMPAENRDAIAALIREANEKLPGVSLRQMQQVRDRYALLDVKVPL